jgi:hypothetical protein
MAILNNSNAISSGAGGYDINNSLRLRSSASAYLSRTPSSTGSRTTFTYSAWVKTSVTQYNSTIFSAVNTALSGACFIRVHGDGGVDFGQYNTGADFAINTVALCRDPAAWYHIVVAVDDTQATSSNRVKIYINGVQQTLTGTYPTQNQVLLVNDTKPHYVGKFSSVIDQYFDGYLAEVYFINGSQLTPSDFGETDTTTGSWKPKAYTGTYGTNGFYFKFSDIAQTVSSNVGLGKDFSGNANYFVTNNISVTAGTTYDAMIDSPTLTSATVANYAVMNPLTAQGITVSEANLNINGNTGSNQRILGTIATGTSGKFYWEVTTTNAFQAVVGVAIQSSNVYMEAVGDGNYYYGGNTKINGSAGPTLSTYTNGDVIGVAFDSSTGKIYFSKNGTWQNSGDPAAGTGSVGTLTGGNDWFAGSASQGTSTYNHKYNFGQRPFSYTPPTGFVRLNTFNLPDSTIKKGNTVMDATTYTGNGTGQSVVNTGTFKPDLVWVKSRSTADWHQLVDSRRGVGLTLATNSTAGDQSYPTSITAFNSNGFTVGADATGGWNINGTTIVGWQWQAGQGSSSSNTSGSITSTVSVNTTAGFSIVTYTSNNTGGATVGHGLGVKPSMIILKRRPSTSDWDSYHTSLGATKGIALNSTAAATTSINFWNNTEPTSTVFTLGAGVNPASTTMLAYCWAEIAGFSKFGSYTGNGSTDGPFVYTGFRPRFILLKRTNAVANWILYDTARATYNVVNNILLPDSASAELTNADYNVDIVSNGFKFRTTQGGINGSSDNIIYMAFAENPFKNANAR